MEHARFYVAAKGYIFHGEKFLILKKFSLYNGDSRWELPGGRLEYGEGPEEALSREAWEETGLKITVDSLIGTWKYTINPIEELLGLNYICYVEDDFVSLSKEHIEYKWITLSEVEDYEFYQGVIKDIEKLNIGKIITNSTDKDREIKTNKSTKPTAMIEEFKEIKKWKEVSVFSALGIIPCILLFNSRFIFLGFLGLIAAAGMAFYANSKYKCPACGGSFDSRTEEVYCPRCGVQLKEIEEEGENSHEEY